MPPDSGRRASPPPLSRVDGVPSVAAGVALVGKGYELGIDQLERQMASSRGIHGVGSRNGDGR